VLDITLTARGQSAGAPIRWRACRITRSSSTSRADEAGPERRHRRAIGDPATTKGPLERKVARIVTPGTVTDAHLLDARRDALLAAVVVAKTRAGIAWLNLASGALSVTDAAASDVATVLERIEPAEVLVPTSDAAAAARHRAALPQRARVAVRRGRRRARAVPPARHARPRGLRRGRRAARHRRGRRAARLCAATQQGALAHVRTLVVERGDSRWRSIRRRGAISRSRRACRATAADAARHARHVRDAAGTRLLRPVAVPAAARRGRGGRTARRIAELRTPGTPYAPLAGC
jgi:DNA mismatch repair protein MutS